MVVKATGTFIREGTLIFRTEAKIQWGESEDPLGIIIMLNPGSSSLTNVTQWDRFESGVVNMDSGEIKLDHTMQMIVDILESAMPRLDGVLHIYNLFDLRNSEADAAIDLYKELLAKNIESLERNFSTDFLSQFPWIWIAWGVDDKKEINARKRKVKILVRLSRKPLFGIYTRQKKFLQSNPRIHYYHPLPQNPNQKQAYKEAMIAQFKCFLETGCVNFLD